MTEGEPPSTFRGTEVARMIGGLWIQAEGLGTMPDGTTAISQLTVGFDSEKGRYVGTWLSSTMPNLWVYEGAVDDAGTVLTLNTSGPHMSGDGRTARYRELLEWKSDDLRTFTSEMENEDGSWQQVVSMEYHRVK